jgi:negative regulator of replication initiation
VLVVRSIRLVRRDWWSVIGLTIVATACVQSPQSALTQLMESRRLASDLLVQFTKAADASNRAVMADTDEASTTFAREAERATGAVQKDVEVLRPLLSSLGFTDEARLLEEFIGRYGEYRKVDGEILSLAVENTNLKAQRLSFGAANEAADLFRRSVEGVVAANPAKDEWHLKALVGGAVSPVRAIQVLQAPHIAEATDDAMTRMEKQMAAHEAEARSTLHSLESLAAPASRGQVAAAKAALDRFMELNAQIVALSRRNTNVRSLALALGQQRTLTAACEDQLRQLQDALATRDFKATR